MTSRNAALFAMFVGPAAAAIDLGASYVLVYPAQATGSKLALHVVTVACAVVTVVAIAVSRRAFARSRGQSEVDTFLGLSGMVLNAFFLLVICGMVIPKMVHGPWD